MSAEELQWNQGLTEMSGSELFKTKDKLERMDPEDRPRCQSNPEMISPVSRPVLENSANSGNGGRR